jgi:hypothetical protein
MTIEILKLENSISHSYYHETAGRAELERNWSSASFLLGTRW